MLKRDASFLEDASAMLRRFNDHKMNDITTVTTTELSLPADGPTPKLRLKGPNPVHFETHVLTVGLSDEPRSYLYASLACAQLGRKKKPATADAADKGTKEWLLVRARLAPA